MTPGFQALERALWIANAALEGALIAWLWRQKLHVSYRYFWFYLIFDLLFGVVLAAVPARSTLYGHLYFLAEFVKLGLLFGVVLDTCRMTLDRYPSIAAAGRKAVQASFAAAILLSTVAAGWESSLPKGDSPILFYLLVALRSGMVTLAVATILIFAFLSWFPVRMSQNSVRFLTVFLFYLGSKAAFLFALNYLGYDLRQIVSLSIFGLAAVCITLWLAGLRREGEYVSTVVRPALGPGREEVLVAQLDAINASLLRIAGK